MANIRELKKRAFVILDVRKAFDTVWHNGLAYGFCYTNGTANFLALLCRKHSLPELSTLNKV